MTFNQFFGVPASSERFIAEHPVFSERLTLLSETMSKTFLREGVPTVAADTLVFFLGRKCCEEFFEIVLLAANGYNIGPIKLLRSLYENAVTLAYLAKHADEVEAFRKFQAVHVHRAHDNFKKVFSDEAYKANTPAELIKEIEDNYAKVQGDFLTTACKKCKTKKMQQGWTKKSPEQLAELVGREYKVLYMDCYFFPMLQLHTTAHSIMPQIQDVNGKLTFNPESGKRQIDDALSAAHQLIIHVLFTQSDHFNLGLDEELIQRFQDFMDSWPDRAPTEETLV